MNFVILIVSSVILFLTIFASVESICYKNKKWLLWSAIAGIAFAVFISVILGV